ncbi:TPA: hyaluronoglucosaminidase, partial [Streptococcus pyogenes]|nr:hyaluronoglucosaminidase [Streptococcus pyogenes]
THENPSVDKEYDKNAAALSIDIVKKKKGGGNGTAAQGIFINSSTGTTGKMLRIRNKNDDKFYVNPDGGFHSYADSIVDGNLTVKNPTSNEHAVTKKYVDEKFDELKELIQKK